MTKHKRSIVMVCSQMPPVYGGAGAQAALLGRSLSQLGWKVTAVTLDQAGVGSGFDRGVQFHRLLRGMAPVGRWRRIVTTLMLGLGAFLHIAIKRPAVVHIHGAFWWSILPSIAGRAFGAKVVIKLTRDGEDDARTVYSKRLGPLRVGKLYGLSLTLAHAVVVLNQRAYDVAVSAGLGNRARLITNGVDEERFRRSTTRRGAARTDASLTDGDRLVIFVGYLVVHKGVVDLLQAWRLLGDRRTKLWLVGPYEGFYRELDGNIPYLVEQLQNDGFDVVTTGHVPVEEIPPLYWAADVFCLPSYTEGMPNSLAEAIVAGCDVVATRIPGIVDLLGSDSSCLVDAGDVPALRDRLADAIRSPQPPPISVVEKLGMRHVSRVYAQLYSELFRENAR